MTIIVDHHCTWVCFWHNWEPMLYAYIK